MKKRVLIVHESLTVRMDLQEAFQEAEFEAVLCASVDEARKVLPDTKCDLILLEESLPGAKDPIHAKLANLPVLPLSGAYDRATLVARANQLFKKPGNGSSALNRVMIVDDSLTFMEIASAELRQAGYEVFQARSGEDGLKALEDQSPDCILLDLIMPGMSGTDCCKRIKESARWRDIPVLLMTAQDDRDAMFHGFNAGADDFIAKGNEFEVLKVRVRAQIRRREFELETLRIREELNRKEMEAAESRANRELAETRAKLLLQLESANKELEAFSYSVSHDLRAPLRAMMGFGTILMNDYGKVLDDAGRAHLNRVIDAAKRMGILIDSLLSLSRMNQKALERKPVDLSALAKALLAELSEADRERKAELVIAEGLNVNGDAGLLQATLQNLIGNAWKFTSKKPAARIEVGKLETPEGPAYFVRDNGAGFDMEYSKKLFGVFQRLHAQDEFEGIGIGLATVQRIINRHGGRIWAEGKPGEGATFYFTLPSKAD